MSNIDKLAKAVPGSRTTYEAFCEFAHPSSSTFSAFTAKIEKRTDGKGIHWIYKVFAPLEPSGFLIESQDIFKNTFHILADMLQRFQGDLEIWSQQKNKIHALTKRLIQEAIKNNRELFDPYEPCPCGSQKKLKFCCKT
jgi:hypothetical protein